MGSRRRPLLGAIALTTLSGVLNVACAAGGDSAVEPQGAIGGGGGAANDASTGDAKGGGGSGGKGDASQDQASDGAGGGAGSDSSVDGAAGGAGSDAASEGGSGGSDAGADAAADADAGGCATGTADCDNIASNGCETTVSSDLNNCGTCGNVCPPGPNETPYCYFGSCALACQGSFGDCDKLASTGCEANLDTDTSNCGACGQSCGNGQCLSGACQCAGSTQKGQLLPLDMYIMLDESGSMTDLTSAGPTKWDAVKQALTGFMADPQSSGLGVGIQYFPLLAAGIPSSCTADAQCPGTTGPCLLKTCSGLSTVTPCSKNSDCFGYGSTQCVALGTCGGQYCSPATGWQCSNGFACNALTSSFCANATDSCTISDYATPAVEIAALPGVAPAITASINAHSPFGATPTSAALQGAIDHASTWATAHPSDKVVVVMATDGLPNECTPNDINGVAAIAATGAAANPSILTFVIGVVAPTDPAGTQANLDQLASSGGTQQAIVIDTNNNVTQQFIDALNAIRKQALGCNYALPAPTDGGTLDYGKVNVQWTPTGQPATVLKYVTSQASCDPATGGWYYDDPASPTKIILCGASCTSVQQDLSSQIDIVLGCATKQ